MKKQLNNPFICTLGATVASALFTTGNELFKDDNNNYFWLTGYNNYIQIREVQNFDDFGNVSYSLRFGNN